MLECRLESVRCRDFHVGREAFSLPALTGLGIVTDGKAVDEECNT